MISGGGNIPYTFKRETERQKELFLTIKRLNFIEKSLKDKMERDDYQERVNSLISKFTAASAGLANFSLETFIKEFGLEDQFYAIQLIKNPEHQGGDRSAYKILDLLHELDTKIAIDKSNNQAYVSEYKVLFGELRDLFERLSREQKRKMREEFENTIEADYQNICGRESNDLIEEIQLGIIQNNLFRFSNIFRRVIMS